MSEDKPQAEESVSDTEVLVALQVEGKDLLCSVEDLKKVFSDLVTIESATVSVSKGFVSRDYGDGKEDYFQSLNLNFGGLWAPIKKEEMLDPKKARAVQKAANEVITNKIGMAKLFCYRTVLNAVHQRAQELGLKKILMPIEKEKEAFSKGEFDPLGVLKKGKK